MGLIVYGIRTTIRYTNEYLLKSRKYARRDAQKCLIVKCCSKQPIWSLFICATPPKWSGRFYHGNWHIWARRPWLWGYTQQHCKPQALVRWHSQFSSVLCYGLCVLIMFPARLNFQRWKKVTLPELLFLSIYSGRQNNALFQLELLWRKVKSY